MKRLFFTCSVLIALPAAAASFSVAKSSSYQRLQCDGGACTWLQWNNDRVTEDGDDLVVHGRGTFAFSEREERRQGDDKLVGETPSDLVVRCSLTAPEVIINVQIQLLNLDRSVTVTTPSSVYFRVCHNIAPASQKKFKAVIDKYYTK